MRVLRIARWAVVGLLLAVLAGPAILVTVGHLTVVEVDGRSMEPTIRFGDVVVIRPPQPSDLVQGAIVTAQDSAGAKYTHRIVGETDDGALLLKGDNNSVDDPAPVPTSSVVGVVAAHFAGPSATVITQLQSWPLRVCVLVMIIGLVFLPVPAAGSVSRRRRRAESPVRGHGRRSAGTDVRPPARARALRSPLSSGSSGETLALVESIQAAIAGVLVTSNRALTGQYTVRVKPGTATFPRVQMLIEITDHAEPRTPSAAVDAGPTVRTVVPPISDATALLYARTTGSMPADLPTRRSQRVVTAHGRRRAGRAR